MPADYAPSAPSAFPLLPLPASNITPLAPAPIMSDSEIQRTWRIAEALAQSRQFADVTAAATAFARILLGRDLGLSPTQALMGLDVVEGNLQMRGVLLLSFVRRSPVYDYEIPEQTEEACTIVFHGVSARTGQWERLGDSRYTVDDAQKAGLIKPDKPKAAWNAHRRNMLTWRAASNGVKFHCPDLLGGIPVYVEGEIERTPQLGEGAGDGGEPGWGTLPIPFVHEVERLIRRAQAVGHVGLSDKATAQMLLKDGSTDDAQRWIDEARAELERFQAADVQGEEKVYDASAVSFPVATGGVESLDPEMMAAQAEAFRARRTDEREDVAAMEQVTDSEQGEEGVYRTQDELGPMTPEQLEAELALARERVDTATTDEEHEAAVTDATRLLRLRAGEDPGQGTLV